MAKVKIDFDTADINALNDPDEREDKLAEIYNAVDACIDSVSENLKASITIDTNKA